MQRNISWIEEHDQITFKFRTVAQNGLNSLLNLVIPLFLYTEWLLVSVYMLSITIFLSSSSLLLIFGLYSLQPANLVNCDWLVASGSDCHLVQILTLHSNRLNGCDWSVLFLQPFYVILWLCRDSVDLNWAPISTGEWPLTAKPYLNTSISLLRPLSLSIA
jgi:hypothetical protein